MNREIKFRAWDKEKKEMREVTGINWYAGYIRVDRERLEDLPIEDTSIMQYVGLKDKNGKEIYESDLVNVEFNDGSKYEDPLEVYFEKGAFMVGMGYLHDIKSIEVIGNIYKNPNLLNKENEKTNITSSI